MVQESDERASETTGRAMKRRGILAAAGAAVAGLVAKQTSEPVGATAGMFLSNPETTLTNNPVTGPTQVASNGSYTSGLAPLIGNGNGGNARAGIYGTVLPGLVTTPPDVCGVFGTASTGVGVVGVSTGGSGVKGTSTNGVGVAGTSTSGSGVAGGTGSAAPGTAGGYFYTTADNGSGVVGQCFNPGGGAAAFVGAANAPNYAAYFTGNVVVNGKLVVSDPSYKSGALQHPDGSTRLVYCVESPESWIEDVGTGALTNGTATVTFDADFAALTHTDDYHVFITQHDGHHHPAVTARGPSGFTVEADAALAALKGKKASELNGTFSWKVMVKAKSAVKSERLAKFAMPTIKTAGKPPLDTSPPAPAKKP